MGEICSKALWRPSRAERPAARITEASWLGAGAGPSEEFRIAGFTVHNYPLHPSLSTVVVQAPQKEGSRKALGGAAILEFSSKALDSGPRLLTYCTCCTGQDKRDVDYSYG